MNHFADLFLQNMANATDSPLQRTLLFFRRRFSKRISPDYLFYAAITLVLSLVVSLIISPILYRNCLRAHKTTLSFATNDIQNLVHLFLVEIQNTITYIGDEIRQTGMENLQGIVEHLKSAEAGQRHHNALYNYTLLDWLTPDSYLVANSRRGIINPPVKINGRSYSIEAPAAPWKMILCAPAWGMTSGLWIIPFGIGVTTAQGEFLGMLTGGLNIQSLKREILKHLQDPFTQFLLCDKEMNLICHSLDNQTEDLSGLVRSLFGAFHCKTQIEGLLEQPVKIAGADFYSYRKLDDFPIYIFTALTPKVMKQEFSNQLFFQYVEILGFTLFFLIILYFFGQRMKKERVETDLALLKQSRQTENALLQKIGQESFLCLEEVEGLVIVLLKNVKRELDFSLSNEQQDNLLTSIYDSIENLKNATTGALNISEVDLLQVIERGVQIQSSLALSKGVQLLSLSRPQMYRCSGDEVRLQQIVTSLLHRAIACTPRGGEVQVEVKVEESHLQLTIKHNGFGLTEADLSRLNKRFSNKESCYSSPLALEFAAIQRLVKLHEGTFEMQAQGAQWTIFTVTLQKSKRALPF